MTPSTPRPAATVIVLRDGPSGLETLMLQRSARTGFFPHAWVFPGGRVDPSDAGARVSGRVAGLPDDQRAFAVAAIRECFEELGVWLGEGQADARLRADLHHRRRTLADVEEVVADLGRLRLWSWWMTPELEPKRYDTLFFVAHVEGAESGRHDPVEADQSAWCTPAELLERSFDDRFFLVLPTWWTLRELARYDSVGGVLAAASGRQIRRVMPRLDQGPDGGVQLVLPGDPTYPSDTPVDGPTRVAVRGGSWRGVG